MKFLAKKNGVGVGAIGFFRANGRPESRNGKFFEEKEEKSAKKICNRFAL